MLAHLKIHLIFLQSKIFSRHFPPKEDFFTWFSSQEKNSPDLPPRKKSSPHFPTKKKIPPEFPPKKKNSTSFSSQEKKVHLIFLQRKKVHLIFPQRKKFQPDFPSKKKIPPSFPSFKFNPNLSSFSSPRNGNLLFLHFTFLSCRNKLLFTFFRDEIIISLVWSQCRKTPRLWLPSQRSESYISTSWLPESWWQQTPRRLFFADELFCSQVSGLAGHWSGLGKSKWGHQQQQQPVNLNNPWAPVASHSVYTLTCPTLKTLNTLTCPPCRKPQFKFHSEKSLVYIPGTWCLSWAVHV